MLTVPALDSLARMLASVNASFGLPALRLGEPDLVRKASEEAAKVFQGFAKASPSKADAYAAALAFMRGHTLDENQVDLVASALSERIREQGGDRPLGYRKLAGLLESYRRDADEGNLWRLTWFGLLGSYFAFDPLKAPTPEQTGWGMLRTFLERTWPLIDRQSGTSAVPDWVRVLRGDPDLLGSNAAQKYAADYLRGDDSAVNRLSEDLGIPESSWFWHELVLSAVRASTSLKDESFKNNLPRLLDLIQARPVYRDEALEILLTRYHKCRDTAVHAELRDYVVRKDVWRNPKLRAAGLATAWNRVSDDVWQMVLGWVNKANLRDFFEVLAARGRADAGRLEFWSRYMEQISWTRLIFSADTKMLASRNAAIRNLIAREEDSYATMGMKPEDAFMMQLGNYMVIEFSQQPNAAYVYKVDQLPYDPYAREYSGTTADLKAGYHGEKAARFTHQRGWEIDAASELRRLGIKPDEAGTSTPRVTRVSEGRTQHHETSADTGKSGAASFIRQPTSTDGAPEGAAFTMMYLRSLIDGHAGVTIDDNRGVGRGRLWVEDPKQRVGLGNELKRLGFKWAERRQAWYYPED